MHLVWRILLIFSFVDALIVWFVMAEKADKNKGKLYIWLKSIAAIMLFACVIIAVIWW